MRVAGRGSACVWDALWTIVRGTPRTHWESHSLAPWVADWERVHEATDHRVTNGTRDHILGAVVVELQKCKGEVEGRRKNPQ